MEGLGVFDPMKFQMVAVRRSLEQLRPRLLLADAVGLGKTIQIGMILTELMRRGRANRILVLTKKSMLTQFQAELWNRFNLPLVRLDSLGIAKLRLRIPTNKNPFEVYQRVIISIDTLKDVGRYRHYLEATRWDVVVIDEAHFDFLQAAYRLLQESQPNYLPLEIEGRMITLTAPEDLNRRLGNPTQKNEMIFGATAIPQEAWPENNQFRLTDDVERVKLGITAARNTSGYWSKELLCSETHPIMQWLEERLLMQFARGEAPIITSRELADKELAFCFIGQVPSKAGTPLIVDAHAVRIRPGGDCEIAPLRETLAAAGFEQLANTQVPVRADIAEKFFIAAAVEASMEHLQAMEKQRQERVRPLLQQEERRLQQWSQKRCHIIDQRLSDLEPNSNTGKRLKKEREDMDKYLQHRQQHWRDMHLLPGESPITWLVLVIEGVK